MDQITLKGDLNMLRRLLGAVDQVAAAVENIGDLKAATLAAEKRKGEIAAEVNQANAELQAVKNAALETNAKANATVEGAQAEANRLRDITEREVADLTEKAKTEADNRIAKAKAYETTAGKKVEAAQVELDRLTGQIATAQKQLDDINAQLEQVRSRLG